MTRKSKGTMLHRGVTFDERGARRGAEDLWCITEEYQSGYVVIARFRTAAEAHKALKLIRREEGRR
jgi:hypothetical protein